MGGGDLVSTIFVLSVFFGSAFANDNHCGLTVQLVYENVTLPVSLSGRK